MTSQAPQVSGYELGQLGQSLPIGVFRTSRDGEFLAANDALARLLGLRSAADLVGRHASDFYLSPGEREEWIGHLDEVGEIRGDDQLLRRADGAIIWVRNSSRCIRDESGEIVRIDGVLEDVTAERADRELWHTAFEEAPVGMAISDLEGNPQRVNAALCALLGYTKDELLGGSLLRHMHPDDGDAATDRLSAIGANTGTDVGEPVPRRLLRKDGTQVSTLIGVSAVVEPTGEVRRILSQVIDVTEARRYEIDLRDSEERFRKAFQDAPMGMIISDSADKPIRVNAAVCSMLGYSEAEMLDESLRPLGHSDEIEATRARIAALLAGESVDYPVERRLRHKDGHYVWVRVRAGSLGLPGGARGILSHIEDVTEQRQVLETIRVNQAENQALLDSIPDLMFRIDAAGIYTWFRPGFEIDPLLEADQFMGKAYREVFPDLADDLGRAIAAISETGKPQSIEYQLEMPDGPRDFEARLVGLGEGDVLLLIRDTTERIGVRRQLERLLAGKDEFIASVSHELRNPLTTVVGLAEELSGGWGGFDDSDVRGMLKLIADQGKDMADLLEDLMAAARADVGMISVEHTRTDLMGEVLGVLAAWPEATARVTTRGSVAAIADPLRVRQVLRNLISNAYRHGGPNIGIEIDQGGGMASIKVCDDGAPVPVEKRELIFDAYYVASTNKDSVGLGLSVSRTLARLMDGELTYDHDGERSIFELRLPLAVR